jgi:hypothetical protein
MYAIPSIDEQNAARDVDDLIDELEATLDRDQRQLLHRLRLAAETLGAIRSAQTLTLTSPSDRRLRRRSQIPA